MNKLVRFYNQNRYSFWLTILIIIAIISIIQILDKFAYKKNIKDLNNNSTQKYTVNKNYSVITGNELQEETSNIIDKFINYCNNQQGEKAYELLSKECKQKLYPSIEDFLSKYYNKIFNNKKVYLYQAWINYNKTYTYKVDFVEDMLATGVAAQTSISDYYTVVNENGEERLNINKFIGIEHINKYVYNNNINIKVIKKYMYMNYEIYEIEVKNNTKYNIKLDDLLETKTIYIEDQNGQRYFWYNNEFAESDIVIERGRILQLDIKYNKPYRPKDKIVKMIFSNIIINNKNEVKIEIGI